MRFLLRHKWLILRRITQLSILSLFLLGPWLGIWIVKGNMASSLTLDFLPLSDPYVLLQSLFAGQSLETTALIGAAIVLLFYLIVGGRAYCSWVCPINIVTDIAASLRDRLNIKGGSSFSRTTRYWILAISLGVAGVTGGLAWELINPVSMVFRGLIFGMGLGWGIIVAIFFFDLLITRHGWCSHFCPVGAFYSVLGRFSLLRISASRRENCDNCKACFKICPEQHVIKPAFTGTNPIIMSANCTNCGRCIDVCPQNVFNFSIRFQIQKETK